MLSEGAQGGQFQVPTRLFRGAAFCAGSSGSGAVRSRRHRKKPRQRWTSGCERKQCEAQLGSVEPWPCSWIFIGGTAELRILPTFIDGINTCSLIHTSFDLLLPLAEWSMNIGRATENIRKPMDPRTLGCKTKDGLS